jgi:phosphoglycerate dehydrogenase-like enzyme
MDRDGASHATVVLDYRPKDDALAAIHEVFAADGVGAEVVNLPDHPSEARAAALRSARALMTWFPARDLSPDDLEAMAGVELVQLLSAGADRVPFDLFPPGAVVAANVGAYADPMAEHAVAMALAMAKHLPQKHAEMARGTFDQLPLNLRIAGSVCAILGFGGIGTATARLMSAFGARIHAVNTTGATDEPVEYCGTLADLDAVLAAADIVVIALPLTRATKGLIGARELDLMKPEAVLVNVARGAIVDQPALYEHLRTHERFGAVIDTWWVEPMADGEFRVDAPFFELPNLLGSPHNSGFVAGIDVIASRRAAENVRRYLRGERPRGIVDPNDYM